MDAIAPDGQLPEVPRDTLGPVVVVFRIIVLVG